MNMAEVRICDICREREASSSYKCKVSTKGRYDHCGSGFAWVPK